MSYSSRPFDCTYNCEYCVAERCPERRQPEGKTQSHTQESWISSLSNNIENPNHLASIKGYVARDKDGTLRFCYHKPERENQVEQTWWGSCDADFDIWNEALEKPFEDLTWDDEPVEVTLVIKRID